MKNYFLLAVVEDKSKFAEIILEQLNDESIKSYVLLLKYSLNFFNNFNALFQSRKILIHKLFEISQRLVSEIGQNFMTLDSLKNIPILNMTNKIYQVLTIYVGLKCESFLTTLSSECAHQIKVNCLDFYVTVVREMLKRLPYKEIIFEQLAFLEPQIVLYSEGRYEIKDLLTLLRV